MQRSDRRLSRPGATILNKENPLGHEDGGTPSAGGASSQAKRRSSGIMSGRKGAYLFGAASGVAFALFAPMLRPAARGAVKGGLRVGRYAKKVASNVKEEFQDIAAEAQADLDREGNSENRKGSEV